jgi:hypothetical protein
MIKKTPIIDVNTGRVIRDIQEQKRKQKQHFTLTMDDHYYDEGNAVIMFSGEKGNSSFNLTFDGSSLKEKDSIWMMDINYKNGESESKFGKKEILDYFSTSERKQIISEIRSVLALL